MKSETICAISSARLYHKADIIRSNVIDSEENCWSCVAYSFSNLNRLASSFGCSDLPLCVNNVRFLRALVSEDSVFLRDE